MPATPPAWFGTGARVATDPRPGAALRLEGIDLSFGGIQALQGVALTVAPGEIRAVIGPNGAGKSSLVNVISGLYRPDRGRIDLAGQSFSRVPTARLARLGVARTFQNLALFRGLSVRDNIALGLVERSRSTFIEQVIGLGRARREQAVTREQAARVIDFLDLAAVADQPAGTLAYGLQKRVELGRALIARPRLLLLDEPLAGMTVAEKTRTAALIRAIRSEWGTAIVLIEHDVGIVLGLSDRVTVLDHGRLLADGPPAEVREDPAVIAAYLGAAPEPEAVR